MREEGRGMRERGKVLQNDFKIKACFNWLHLTFSRLVNPGKERMGKEEIRKKNYERTHTRPQVQRGGDGIIGTFLSHNRRYQRHRLHARGSHNSVFALLCNHSRLLSIPFTCILSALRAISLSLSPSFHSPFLLLR